MKLKRKILKQLRNVLEKYFIILSLAHSGHFSRKISNCTKWRVESESQGVGGWKSPIGVQGQNPVERSGGQSLSEAEAHLLCARLMLAFRANVYILLVLSNCIIQSGPKKQTIKFLSSHSSMK